MIARSGNVLIVSEPDDQLQKTSDLLLDIGHNSDVATTSQKALKLLSQGDYDLLLVIPASKTSPLFSTPKLVRKQPGFELIPIVMVLSDSDSDLINNAVDSGVDDVLLSPFDDRELQLRVSHLMNCMFTRYDLRESQAALNRVRRKMEDFSRQRDLVIGNQIQDYLLLEREIPQVAGIESGMLTLPSTNVNGMLHSFSTYGEGSLDAFFAQPSEEGIEAVLTGLEAKFAHSRAYSHCVHMNLSYNNSPEAIIKRVHELVTPRLAQLEQPLQCGFMRLDPRLGYLTYVDCEFPPIIWFSKSRKKARLLPVSNMPLGFLAEEHYPEKSYLLGDGDIIVAITSGIRNLQRKDGELFDITSLLPLIEKNGSSTVDDLLNLIYSNMATFSKETTINTPITITLFRYKAQKSNIPVGSSSNCVETAESPRDAILNCIKKGLAGAPFPILTANQQEDVLEAAGEILHTLLYHTQKDAKSNPLDVALDYFPDKTRIKIAFAKSTLFKQTGINHVIQKEDTSAIHRNRIHSLLDHFVIAQDFDDNQLLDLVKCRTWE